MASLKMTLLTFWIASFSCSALAKDIKVQISCPTTQEQFSWLYEERGWIGTYSDAPQHWSKLMTNTNDGGKPDIRLRKVQIIRKRERTEGEFLYCQYEGDNIIRNPTIMLKLNAFNYRNCRLNKNVATCDKIDLKSKA